LTRTAHQTSSVKQLYAILHKKQHTFTISQWRIIQYKKNLLTCVIGTIYCDLLDHFRGVYSCYTSQWDLYIEIA
jgi:hypothetical protein